MRISAILAAVVMASAAANAEEPAGAGAATTFDTPARASDVTSAANAAAVLTSIHAARSVAADLQNLPSTGSVNVVDVGTLPGGEDTESIKAAVDANAAAVETLRSTIEGDPAIAAVLAAQGATTADVIAADVDARGNVMIFTYRG